MAPEHGYAAPADSPGPPPPHVPGGSDVSAHAVAERWALPGLPESASRQLADPRSLDESGVYARTIENFIGTVRVPVGLAGPLRVTGRHARGDYYIPLATTEATLVASYSRGAQLLTDAGGCSSVVLAEGVSRTPAFAFDTILDAARFAEWCSRSVDAMRETARATTRYGSLMSAQPVIEGNHVYLVLVLQTADASGQNMATIAADAICRDIAARSPVCVRRWFVEANLSGDKKATMQSLAGVRGRRVSAEVVLGAGLIERRLHTTVDVLLDYWRASIVGGVMSGSVGVQGHYANGLAAMFIACGQDVACVAEAAVGVTRFEPAGDGGLYASVTLPNLIVGTVGGGTGLPSQRACLDIMRVAGQGQARAFAEIVAAVALAGELSITGALAAGHFTRAHQDLARGVAADGSTR